MEEETLVEIGLSANEAKVYLGLLQYGKSTGGQIAEKLKIHRPTAYDALERLVNKTLASFITKDKIKYYTAAKPENLLTLLKNKEEKLKELLPKISINNQEHITNATVYEGKKAIIDLLYDFLSYNSDIMVYGVPKQLPDALKNYLTHFHNDRISKKIHMRHIYNYDSDERSNYLNSLDFTESKRLPEIYDAKVITNICSEEIAITLWIEPIITIRIKSSHIAEAYTKYFEILWSLAKS